MELLLIEDSLADAELFKVAIGEVNSDYPRMSVKVCHSLADARVALSEHKYQLILLDIYLSDASDLSELRELTSLYPDIAIVIYSGTYSQDLSSDAIAMGAQDYIIKGTLSSEDLVRTLFHAKLRQDNLVKLRYIAQQH